MPRTPSVLSIVLNYNGRELTLDTVGSLLAMDYPAHEVLVVDNGSSDGSDEAVAARYPEVHRQRLPTNRWIAGGLNHGLRWAMPRGYDYLLLLNNDLEVDAGMLRELVRLAETDERIGCVGPKCYYFGDRTRIWSAGGELRARESITRERGNGEVDRGQYDVDREVDYINGCAMLVRRQAVAAAGPWDTAFNLGVEDAEFCVRVKKAGFRCCYAHRAVLWHKVSLTVGGYTPGRTFQTGRSGAVFMRRHGRWSQWPGYLVWSALAFPAAWLRELPRGNQAAAVAKAKGVWSGLREQLPPPPSPADLERPVAG